jgi:hypothetical protein
MAFIPPVSPGEGLAIGIGIFIWCSGEACGFGEAAGICIPGVISCDGLAGGDDVGICIPGVISCDGLAEGDDVGICIPGVISCDGLAEGDDVGICIPGVISCDGLAEGDDVGIFIPGIILCEGLAEGDDVGIVIPGIFLWDGPADGWRVFAPVFLVVVLLAFARDFLFLGTVFGFGLPIPGILLMSWPWCCGKAMMLTAKISASAPSVPRLQLLGLFMFFPSIVRKNELRQMLLRRQRK